MVLKALIVTATLAAAGGLALAQAPASAPAAATSATKKALVARVLELQQPGVEAMARQMAEQPAVQIMQQVRPLVQRLPAERRETVARDIEADLRKYVEEATPIVRDRAVKLAPGTIGPLLEERFTEDELKQVVAMLESPVNRKFQQMAPDMQRAIGGKLIAETRGEIEAKVRALDQSVARRLGITPAAGAASGARPAASGARAAPAKKP
jgi:hypothetical protein